MQIQTSAKLSQYSTMRLGGMAHSLTTITSKQELTEALAWADERQLSVLVLGGGSNVIFTDGFDGLVILNRILGFEVLQQDASGATIRIGAGEIWDDVVVRTVQMGLSGIEKLSAIPGTAGATPVQNVGAYGAEIADTFIELEAYDQRSATFVTLDKQACQFTYRDSIFKATKDRHYIITSITLRLSTRPPQPPFYASLQRYLDEHGVTTYTVQTIRDAVMAIRAIKLPDPAKLANTGSFFKNPIIPAPQAQALINAHPDIPHWSVGEGHIKLAAGWLIEQAGLKGYRANGMEVYQHNALVLVNHAAKNYSDLAEFRDMIIKTVHTKFGVTLQQEPELW